MIHNDVSTPTSTEESQGSQLQPWFDPMSQHLAENVEVLSFAASYQAGETQPVCFAAGQPTAAGCDDSAPHRHARLAPAE